MRLKSTIEMVVVLCLVNLLIGSANASDAAKGSSKEIIGGVFEASVDVEGEGVVNQTDSIREQITLLEAKNRLLKEHYESLLRTTHWAIGFAAVFLIAVFGLMGYFTHRRYEQDKESLKNSIETEIAKARADFEGRLSEWESKSADKLQERTKSLEQSLEKIAKSASNAAVGPVENRIKSLSWDLTMLQIDVLKQEAENWKKEDVKGNVVRCWFRIAQKGWFIKQDWIVSEALGQIKLLFAEGAKFDVSQATELNAFLQSLPLQFEPLVKAIQSKI